MDCTHSTPQLISIEGRVDHTSMGKLGQDTCLDTDRQKEEKHDDDDDSGHDDDGHDDDGHDNDDDDDGDDDGDDVDDNDGDDDGDDGDSDDDDDSDDDGVDNDDDDDRSRSSCTTSLVTQEKGVDGPLHSPEAIACVGSGGIDSSTTTNTTSIGDGTYVQKECIQQSSGGKEDCAA